LGVPLTLDHAEPDPVVDGAPVFVSASIPDPARWQGPFDALEITDAVVALARSFLTAGARLVTAAHPTIAPLLLYVAAELPGVARGRIVVYQSEVFEDVLPPATRRFEEEGFGELVWTSAAPGETPDPDNRAESLYVMRRQMLAETEPQAAVFVGGMAGIIDEWKLFAADRPGSPRYPLGYPGGEARRLAETRLGEAPTDALDGLLTSSSLYPAVWRAVLGDLRNHLASA
jgi:SLOG cluster3 family